MTGRKGILTDEKLSIRSVMDLQIFFIRGKLIRG
jgi:hypothetical protein